MVAALSRARDGAKRHADRQSVGLDHDEAPSPAPASRARRPSSSITAPSSGVPAVVFAEHYLVMGAQPYAVFEQVLRQCGDNLTRDEGARVLSELVGRTVKAMKPPMFMFRFIAWMEERKARRTGADAAKTRAVAIAAIPSPRPVRPRPSVVVADTDTGAPSNSPSTRWASSRRGPTLGRLPIT